MANYSQNKPLINDEFQLSNALTAAPKDIPELKLAKYNFLKAIHEASRRKNADDTYWLFVDDDNRIYSMRWTCELLGYDILEIRRKLADVWFELDWMNVRLTRYVGHAKNDPVSKYFDED